jgi:hypothetical protein
MNWELFSRELRYHKGKRYFFERWVHKPSKSGMIFYSTIRPSGERFYVVEGYGIGTIDPYKFREIAGIAPIQRFECDNYYEARKRLRELQRENLELWSSKKG